VLGKNFAPMQKCGETWELSAVKGSLSVVTNGRLKGANIKELIEGYRADLLGAKTYNSCGTDFPLLVKFIDAQQDLSIQVHPNDSLAQERHDCLGKTEMWYIVDAEPEASLISGFSQRVNADNYLLAMQEGKIEQILNRESAQKGDVFYIPAGRVHTIGKGLLIAEIQQTSDITYRIYDFDRIDKDGNRRELHVDQALEAIDFSVKDSYKTDYDKAENTPVSLVKNQYFETNKLHVTKTYEADYGSIGSFVIYTIVEGKATLHALDHVVEMEKGQVWLLPAITNQVRLETETSCELLETYIP
jgi:mannose-6-phosphate isomerase